MTDRANPEPTANLGNQRSIPWTRKNLDRSYPCNAAMVKFFRRRKNWVQQQLAEHSGLGLRAIGKAESGSNVSTRSIAKLAAALSGPEQTVYPEDLISFPSELAKKFVQSLHSQKDKMSESVAAFVDAEAVFRIAGDPKKIPFAGEHKSFRAFCRALRRFYQIMDVPQKFDPISAFEFYEKGTDVMLWGSTLVSVGSSRSQPERLPRQQRFRFRKGKLYSYEDLFDIRQGEKMVADAAEIRGHRVYDPLEDSGSGDFSL